MFLPKRSSLFLLGIFLGLTLIRPGALSAETLPDRRPALIGSGAGSLVNLIDAEGLFQKGQRDGWVTFDCLILPDGITYGSDFFTASPNSDLLKNEIRRRFRQTRFIPAVYNHKRTYAWFSGTAVFVVTNGRPHLRLYANQDFDEVKRGADFVAPQQILIPNHDLSNLPNYPSKARHDEAAGIVKLRHSVDADGKTTNVQAISEQYIPRMGGGSPSSYEFATYVMKLLPMLDFLPGYRNGRPTATSYTLTWAFGRTIHW